MNALRTVRPLCLVCVGVLSALSCVLSNTAFAQSESKSPVLEVTIECPAPPASEDGHSTQENSQANSDDKGNTKAQRKRKVAQIEVTNNTIFDEKEEGTMFIHELANWMHVTTKEEVILERLPFKEDDELSDDDLQEAERIIRSQPYIRDVVISFKESCDINEPAQVEIQTWDNWSLIPTLSFGRKGGENKFSLGVKEDNVLGTGIRARFKYNTDEQRTGYQFTLKSPFPYVPFSTVFFDFLDNDDGQISAFEFDKPFYHLRTENMFNVSLLTREKTEDIFQNGLTRNSFSEQSHRYSIAGGWQLAQEDNYSTRIKFGYVDESLNFMSPDLLNVADTQFLPQDRNFQYPWIGLEYAERNFKTMSDIYLIKQTEDINLGWHHEISLGLELNDIAAGSNLGYHLFATSSKGYEWFEGLVLASIDGQAHINTTLPNNYRVSANLEYFKRYSDLLGVYGRVSGTFTENPFLDAPVSVGDDDGVRGYPLQYQHGDKRFSSSIEARFYTNYSLWKILELGFVTFADVGQAWGGEQANFNETDALLTSLGAGVRLYSSRSSHKSVIHMDIAKPFATSVNVDSWQWRLQIKQSF